MSRTRRTRPIAAAGVGRTVSASGIRVGALAIALLVLAALLGVMFQAQFRGDDSPDDVAARYVEAARAGDRVTLFLLTHPDRDLSVMLDRRVERYREIGAEELTISLEAHSVAAYFVDVRVEHAGRPFDQIGLQHIGRRWYIVNVEE